MPLRRALHRENQISHSRPASAPEDPKSSAPTSSCRTPTPRSASRPAASLVSRFSARDRSDRFAREWVNQLGHFVPLLIELPTLVLSQRPAKEYRVCLQEAARCYAYGLLRSTAILARKALEVMLAIALRRRRTMRTSLDRTDPPLAGIVVQRACIRSAAVYELAEARQARPNLRHDLDMLRGQHIV